MKPRYFNNNRPLTPMNELPEWAQSEIELMYIHNQTEEIIDNVRYVYDVELEKIQAEKEKYESVRNQMNKLGII